MRPRGLRTREDLDRVAAAIVDVAGLAGDLVDRCRQLNAKISDLERRLGPLVSQLAPNLLTVSGSGLLSAGKLIGETGRASRFRSINAFARFNGSAPVPVHSGNSEKMRLNRGGNRTALHMIAVTQLRRGGPGADYVAKRQAAGDDKTEAVRLLRRRVSDAVFKAMLADERQRDDRDHSHSSGDGLAVAA